MEKTYLDSSIILHFYDYKGHVTQTYGMVNHPPRSHAL